MIPKVIHYCWFGKNDLPEMAKKCIDSWKKFCPDYEIIEWNETNFDVSQNSYCQEAYDAKKWAFVSDFARLKIIYENGGIYLDTDVELIKPLTDIISDGNGYIGFQNQEEVNTGLGFAAASKNICIKQMLELYESRHFIDERGKIDLTPCPVSNTVALKSCGLKTGRKNCKRIQNLEGINIYPIFYFNPMNPDTMKLNITQKTYTVHHYAASWCGKSRKYLLQIKKILPNFLLNLRTNYISKRDIKNMENKLS